MSLNDSGSLPDLMDLGPWLSSVGWPGCRVEPLTGDVGARRYLRIHCTDGSTAVLAIYPPEMRPAARRFLATTGLLRSIGVRVPEVLAEDWMQGHVLVEDLGDATMEAWARDRPGPEVAERFRAASRTARRVASLDPAAVEELSPPLDRVLLARELALTRESFLEPRGLARGTLARRLDASFAALAEAIAAVPPVPCHRDFMVRNLMPWREGVAVLDHQDLRLGPPLYDLASLLNDTLFPDPELEAELLAVAVEAPPGGDLPTDRRLEYHRVAAQRTLKAVGSYAMAARRGQRHHVERIGPTFERALAHLAAVPETTVLAEELGAAWASGDSGGASRKERKSGG